MSFQGKLYVAAAWLLVLAIIRAEMSSISLKAQTGGGALVVTTCGTLPLAYIAGATRQLTVNTNGQVCQ